MGAFRSGRARLAIGAGAVLCAGLVAILSYTLRGRDRPTEVVVPVLDASLREPVALPAVPAFFLESEEIDENAADYYWPVIAEAASFDRDSMRNDSSVAILDSRPDLFEKLVRGSRCSRCAFYGSRLVLENMLEFRDGEVLRNARAVLDDNALWGVYYLLDQKARRLRSARKHDEELGIYKIIGRFGLHLRGERFEFWREFMLGWAFYVNSLGSIWRTYEIQDPSDPRIKELKDLISANYAVSVPLRGWFVSNLGLNKERLRGVLAISGQHGEAMFRAEALCQLAIWARDSGSPVEQIRSRMDDAATRDPDLRVRDLAKNLRKGLDD